MKRDKRVGLLLSVALFFWASDSLAGKKSGKSKETAQAATQVSTTPTGTTQDTELERQDEGQSASIVTTTTASSNTSGDIPGDGSGYTTAVGSEGNLRDDSWDTDIQTPSNSAPKSEIVPDIKHKVYGEEGDVRLVLDYASMVAAETTDTSIATAGADGLRIWDLNGTLMMTHPGNYSALAISKDGKMVAMLSPAVKGSGRQASIPSAVTIINVFDLRKFTIEAPNDMVEFSALTFSGDAGVLFVGQSDGKIMTWNNPLMAQGSDAAEKELKQLVSVEAKVLSLSVTGDMLACASEARSISVWKLNGQAFSLLRRYQGDRPVSKVVFLPKDEVPKLLVVEQGRFSVRKLNEQSFTLSHALPQDSRGRCATAVSKDYTHFIAGADDTLYFYDLATGKEKKKVRRTGSKVSGINYAGIETIAPSADLKSVVMCSITGTLISWLPDWTKGSLTESFWPRVEVLELPSD